MGFKVGEPWNTEKCCRPLCFADEKGFGTPSSVAYPTLETLTALL